MKNRWIVNDLLLLLLLFFFNNRYFFGFLGVGVVVGFVGVVVVVVAVVFEGYPVQGQPLRVDTKNAKDTLWLFNIAMENGPFIDGLPIKNR